MCKTEFIVPIFLILLTFFGIVFSNDITKDITNHKNWNLFDHDRCGISYTDRIIGGNKASLGQFPWLAQIGYSIENIRMDWVIFQCGGSLINNIYVITAAHCVTNLLPGLVVSKIRLGEYDTDTNIDCEDDLCAPAVQDFYPTKLIFHENYESPPFKNDIALIRLDKPAQLNEFVSPICLPHGSLLTDDFSNMWFQVAGWGVYNMTSPEMSQLPLYTSIPFVDRKICDEKYREVAKVGIGQLCAGGEENKDSCGGDSGGPLMKVAAVQGSPKYYLMGLVSFGTKYCGGTSPAVYTDVMHYLIWILDNVFP